MFASPVTVIYILHNLKHEILSKKAKKKRLFWHRSPNKMHMLQSLFLSDDCSTCFGYHDHSSSGAQNNFNYSIW